MKYAKCEGAYKKAKELNTEKVYIRGKKLFVNSDSYFSFNLPDYLLSKKKPINQHTVE